MNDSKIKKILFSSILLVFLLIGVSVLAQDQDLEQLPDVPILGKGGVLDKITKYLLSGLVFGAVICFVVAGYYFITSAGDPQKFDTAKKIVLYGVIGLLIAFSAWGIVKLVKNIFISTEQRESPGLDPGGEMGPW